MLRRHPILVRRRRARANWLIIEKRVSDFAATHSGERQSAQSRSV